VVASETEDMVDPMLHVRPTECVLDPKRHLRATEDLVDPDPRSARRVGRHLDRHGLTLGCPRA
jgi:hypothetical protein